MKTMMLLLILVSCLGSVGCSGPVKEVKAYIDAKDDVILQMGKKIEENPTEAGVDEARKIFEARKDDLKAKTEVVRQKKLGPHADLLSMLTESDIHDTQMFDALRVKLPTYDAMQKLSRLERDFKEAVKR
jgi:hypothetical protein